MTIITPAALLTLAATVSTSTAQECSVAGGFTLEFEGSCNYETILSAYTDQVYNAAGALASGCSTSAKADFDAKLLDANMTVEDMCSQIYRDDNTAPFSDAAAKGDDLNFEQHFFNGRSEWQEEVETIYETEDGTPTSVLKEDAES
eukprot:scaffold3687_cov303-Alexandrium_tamarense.AAC.1